ncbi:MAG TPA: heavy-metal-associated domain-containing protein [Flavobacterium sp.]|nr:heavy-metal-associated domain-containing protein [Flavobacterium sp.]
MKITKTLLAMAFAGMLFTACKDAGKAPADVADAKDTAVKTDAPAGKIETASFHIEGMTCAIGCAKTIEGKLSGLDGVQKATVDFDKKTATVEFDASKQTPEKLVETVEATADGKTYKVSDVKSSGDHAMLIDKDKDKKKKKTKKEKAAEKKGCTSEGKTEGKGCCSGKKACHGEEKA